jgi:hypothetical protein
MGEPLTPDQEAERDMDAIFERHGPELQAAIQSAFAPDSRATMVPLTPEMARAQADLHAENKARIAKLEGLVGDLAVVLEAARAQFQFYADEHTKAGKLEKAKTNQSCADECADFLARIKQELPE